MTYVPDIKSSYAPKRVEAVMRNSLAQYLIADFLLTERDNDLWFDFDSLCDKFGLDADAEWAELADHHKATCALVHNHYRGVVYDALYGLLMDALTSPASPKVMEWLIQDVLPGMLEAEAMAFNEQVEPMQTAALRIFPSVTAIASYRSLLIQKWLGY